MDLETSVGFHCQNPMFHCYNEVSLSETHNTVKLLKITFALKVWVFKSKSDEGILQS